MCSRVLGRVFTATKALLVLFILSGCLESNESVFQDTSPTGGVLSARYTATDGKKPMGELRLQEANGVYTVLASSDQSSMARPAPGRTFKLFPSQMDGHPLEDTFGEFEYYWLEASKENVEGYEYELLAISKRKERFVFRWSNWTFHENEGFLDALLQLASSYPELLQCSGDRSNRCVIKDKEALQRVGALVARHNLNPIRAYVPR